MSFGFVNLMIWDMRDAKLVASNCEEHRVVRRRSSRSQRNRKCTPVNAFSAIRPRGEFPFPYHPTKFCIFLELTDAEGTGNGWVAIRDAATDEFIFSGAEHAIHFEHRLQIKRVNFAIKGCVFPVPGLYLIEFYLQDPWIVDRPLEIKA